LGKWGLDRGVLPAHYQGPIRKVVTSLKYKRITAERDLVAKLIAGRLDKKEFKGFILTPVPLHFQAV
jgi:predicted amidophosphoribosyltransferase